MITNLIVGKMKLQPIVSNLTLKDRVYDRLREAIVEMNIYQADADLRLDERTMAEQLQVSRTPLREALTRLERDGLIEIRARKGVFVVRRTLEEILEMIVAWAALESMAARLATDVASDADLRNLRKHALRHSESSANADLSEYSDANIKFHQMILDMSGCALLAEMADGLFVHMHAVRRRALEENDRASRSVVDHMGIIEALEARDADLTAQLVREHTMRLHNHVRRVWSKFENRRESIAG
ncbi:MAG: GntR family transcriptional regulator [Paracoccaceae bacterium]